MAGLAHILLLALHGITPLQNAATPEARQKLEAMGTLLIWLFVLVLVFLVGSLAILRYSRRFQATLTPARGEPTPTDDVWAMHKLPDGAVESIPEDPTQDPAESDDERSS